MLKYSVLLAVSMIFVILISGCVNLFSDIHGCFGENEILDLNINPKFACLSIRANNCNDGVLEITNNCDQKVKIGDLDIPKGDFSFELLKDEVGNVYINYTRGNYATYNPKNNETLSINGFVGESQFHLSYLKTSS